MAGLLETLKRAWGDAWDAPSSTEFLSRDLTWATPSGGGGGGGAPTGATYLTLATNGSLTHERVLTAGTAITMTDAGAGSTLTVDVDVTTLEPLLSVGNLSGGWTTIMKTANEDVTSSTVVQDDDTLTFTIPDGETWAFELYVAFLTTSANDFKWNLPRTNIGTWFAEVRYQPGGSGTLSAFAVDTATTTGADASVTGAGIPGLIWIRGIGTAIGGDAVVTFQWAQNSSGATATTVKAGSYILTQRVS